VLFQSSDLVGDGVRRDDLRRGKHRLRERRQVERWRRERELGLVVVGEEVLDLRLRDAEDQAAADQRETEQPGDDVDVATHDPGARERAQAVETLGGEHGDGEGEPQRESHREAEVAVAGQEAHEVPQGAADHEEERDTRQRRPTLVLADPEQRHHHRGDAQVEAHLPVVLAGAPVGGAAVVVGLRDVRRAVEPEQLRQHAVEELRGGKAADVGEQVPHATLAHGEAGELDAGEQLGRRDQATHGRGEAPPQERASPQRCERVDREQEPAERRRLRVPGEAHHRDGDGDEAPAGRDRAEDGPRHPRDRVLHAQVERVRDEEAGPRPHDPTEQAGQRVQLPGAEERPHPERRPHLVQQDGPIQRQRRRQDQEEQHRRRVEEARLPLGEQRVAVGRARGPPRHLADRPAPGAPDAPREMMVTQVVVPEHALADRGVRREQHRDREEQQQCLDPVPAEHPRGLPRRRP
jgi:hypothetical protein